MGLPSFNLVYTVASTSVGEEGNRMENNDAYCCTSGLVWCMCVFGGFFCLVVFLLSICCHPWCQS